MQLAVVFEQLVIMFAFIVALLCVVFIVVYKKLTNTYKYWEKKGVKGPPPKLLYGNIKTLLTIDSAISLSRKIYNQYPNEKIVGLYYGLRPMLIVRDLELIQKVLVKDFSSFTDRRNRTTNEHLSRNLFMLEGEEWKIVRQKLTPLFSNSKLKQMMPLLDNCVKDYVKYVDKLVEEKLPVEVKTVNMKYTLKAITSVAFGLDIDTFSDEGSQFVDVAEALFNSRSLFRRRVLVIFDGIFPRIFRKIPFVIVKKNISNFFLNLVSQIVKEREGKPKIRKDFMDLMIQLKEQGTVSRSNDQGVNELEITDALIAAQAFVFYAAGFETSSNTMSYMLYELALNQEIQDRCYEEIRRVMNKYGYLTCEVLNEMELVSMAFDETLRKHPIVGVLDRLCVNNYEIPELELTVEKGTKILIPVMALHHDPQYFPDPEKYDPGRFSAERKGSIKSCTYLPFGDGPRNCIGIRLAKIQSILGVSHFLYNYRVTPCEKTPSKIAYNPLAITLTSVDGIYLNVEKRS